MKTIIYVDGFNLYYGCIKNTAYKWLDLSTLFNSIMKAQSPTTEIKKINYFTSNIKVKFASHGQEAQKAQNSYLRALELLYPDSIEIHKGWYSANKAKLPEYKSPPNKEHTYSVWKLEEKETDVRIALEMYRDASKGLTEQIVLVSNDSDLAPALEHIRTDFPTIQIGIIQPSLSRNMGKNAQLDDQSDWYRKEIKEEELAKSQLNDLIATKKEPITKPDYW